MAEPDRERALLLGGTSETGQLAEALVAAGFEVLVSTATDAPLKVSERPQVVRRHGRLNAAALAGLLRAEGIVLLVDAGHPYAVELHEHARDAARECGIELVRYCRPGAIEPRESDAQVVFADDHTVAARLAFAVLRPVLLTTGSRNLEPYVAEARRTGVPLVVRVLPHAESLEACRKAGVPEERIVAARGPFSSEENRALIRRFAAGALVTKDGGEAGGVRAKLEAARAEGCCVIVVRRPNDPKGAFSTIADLVRAVSSRRSGA